MKLTSTLGTAGAGVLALFVANGALYTVSETEQVVITQLGGVVRTVKEPGLHCKIPIIQTVHVFDDRILEYDDAPRDVATKDKKYIKTDNYSRWKIADPVKFMTTVRNETGAQTRLDDIIYSWVREAVGGHNFIEMVRNSNREIQTTEKTAEGEKAESEKVIDGREKIMQLVTENTKKKVEEYGIEAVDVRLKRTDLPKETEASVYTRMISERTKISDRFRSEGEGEQKKIEGQKDKELKTIQSTAYREAQEIMGKADAEAIKIYAEAFEKDPEFYAFIKTLETLQKTLAKEGTKLVISTDSDLFKILKHVQEKKQ